MNNNINGFIIINKPFKKKEKIKHGLTKMCNINKLL